MPTYSYTVAEYDADKPWLVIGPLRHMTIELDEEEDFLIWAAQTWPSPRYQAILDPTLPPWESAG